MRPKVTVARPKVAARPVVPNRPSSARKEGVRFFTGKEVERTVADGLDTLFVVGCMGSKTVYKRFSGLGYKHVFLGANRSVKTGDPQLDEYMQTAQELLEMGVPFVSLDIPHTEWPRIADHPIVQNVRFIVLISVMLPKIRKAPALNVVLKIDDTFGGTNGGVWCHWIEQWLQPYAYTPWSAYMKDHVID